jgi:two-component system response regulator AlgR
MTDALAVLIVDDEPLARLRLRQLLEGADATPVRVVGEAGDAAAALALLEQQRCDLVLLDIALPGRSGLRLADELRRRADPPEVVFVTAHAEHALHAFELEALDYLTKPVRRERLQAALLRARRRRDAAAAPQPTLVVSDRGRVLRLPVADLVCLKADQKYVAIVARSGQWLVDDALTDLEQRLGAAVVRVHRNALAAVAAVRALERSAEAGDGGEAWSVRLANGERLAVSRRQLAAVRAALAAADPAPAAD